MSEEGRDIPKAVASAILENLVPVFSNNCRKECDEVVEDVTEGHPGCVNKESENPGALNQALYFVLY